MCAVECTNTPARSPQWLLRGVYANHVYALTGEKAHGSLAGAQPPASELCSSSCFGDAYTLKVSEVRTRGATTETPLYRFSPVSNLSEKKKKRSL